jgi:diguanylate cyclase (GGDEF)-like protein
MYAARRSSAGCKCSGIRPRPPIKQRVKLISHRLRTESTVLPFVGIAAIAFASTGLRTADTNWRLVVGAAVFVAVVASAAFLLPWPRLPMWALLLLPVAVDGLIAMLRQAQGGSTSGYAPLAVLPVAWVGLTQGRRPVFVISACTGLLFALPIVIVGGPMYPATAWRSVALWTVVALLLGMGAERVVADTRRTTREFARLAEIQTMIALAESDRGGLMTSASEGALALTGADAACIELLEDDEVVCAAAAGTAVRSLGLRLKADDTITGECFRSRQTLICSDSESDSHAHREACRIVGARSLILVPLLNGAETKGVLIVWSAAPEAFRRHESQLLALLANIVAAALVRAELIERLGSQAVTDELTGLPNRRAWYQQLDLAMARARRSGQPLSLLVLDLDSFKQINDRHGHAAGDRQLQSVSGRWISALRGTDLLGRVGGDEFAVILELTGEDGADEVIARLDAAAADIQQTSTGCATWDGHEDAATLIGRADNDMYRHKKKRALTFAR